MNLIDGISTTSEIAEFDAALRAFELSLVQNKLSTFAPYRWQQEFIERGKDNSERMLMAANRVGKTQSAAAEVCIHLLGDYDDLPRDLRYPEFLPSGTPHPNAGELVWPNGWTGKRFDHPIKAWVGSPTNETIKEIVQAELLGSDIGESIGTGWIPKSRIIGKPTRRMANVSDVVESFKVRHKSGGVSICTQKAFEQGWKKWQGTAPHVVWLDEEPDDYMIFSEAQTRILTVGGIVLVTFTPLSGATELVDHFQEGGEGIYVQGASWNDAPHLSKEDKERLAKSYRAHERAARTQGIPMLGEGAVFPVMDDDIMCDAFRVPEHWGRIKACDFGMGHPAAGVEIAYDRDTDTIYVIDCYRKANEKAPYHAAWFNKTNPGIPVAWPHDGMNREKSGGEQLKEAYRKAGANMMKKSARYPKPKGEKREKGGAQPVEPIIDEVLERMMTGRFKVFAHLTQWFEEKRSYHRKNGKIVDRKDDILKATFYGVMMKRYAVSLSTVNASSGMMRVAPPRPIASSRF